MNSNGQIHESTGLDDRVLTLSQKLDRLQRTASNHGIRYARSADDRLKVLDESFVIATKKVRTIWIDISDWSTAHFHQWLGE